MQNTIFFNKPNNPFYLFFCSIILTISISSCGLFGKIKKPVELDSITTNEDTSRTNPPIDSPVVIVPEKVDTIVWKDTLQEGQYKRWIVQYQRIGNGPIMADTLETITIDPNGQFDPNNNPILGQHYEKKTSYNVAIIMPFMTNKYQNSPYGELPGNSLGAIEFYEGVELALDSLEKEGVQLVVNVFDSRGNEGNVTDILQKEALQKADLIIGPVRTKPLQKVAEFAKQHDKVLISPFNPKDNIAKENSRYIQLNPSYTQHSLHVAKFIKNQIGVPEKRIVLLGMPNDTGRIQQIQEAYSDLNHTQKALIPQYISPKNMIDIEDFEHHLSRNALNIIVVPSYKDEIFVYNVFTELHSLIDKIETRKSYKIMLIGMPKWRQYERINFEYYEDLNVHITSEFHAAMDNQEVTDFKNRYKSMYGIAPREYGYTGYDVMLYFGRMLHKHGTGFHKYLSQEPFEGKHTRFMFKEVKHYPEDVDNPNAQPIPMGFENGFINFLEFEDFHFQRIN